MRGSERSMLYGLLSTSSENSLLTHRYSFPHNPNFCCTSKGWQKNKVTLSLIGPLRLVACLNGLRSQFSPKDDGFRDIWGLETIRFPVLGGKKF